MSEIRDPAKPGLAQCTRRAVRRRRAQTADENDHAFCLEKFLIYRRRQPIRLSQRQLNFLQHRIGRNRERQRWGGGVRLHVRLTPLRLLAGQSEDDALSETLLMRKMTGFTEPDCDVVGRGLRPFAQNQAPSSSQNGQRERESKRLKNDHIDGSSHQTPD